MIVVGLAAVLASIGAAAHSRRILADQVNIYPPGTLELTQEGAVDGCIVRIDDADVVRSLASAETRGYDREIAEPNWHYVRLTVSIQNDTTESIGVKEMCETLKAVQISTGQTLETELVWHRSDVYDSLSADELAPGERKSGLVSLYMWEYDLSFPFLVDMGGGQAVWGVDVIDRDAPLQPGL
ncbi:MAG TPA: hypothetical protein QGH10_25050 [Armatimonadota bacterium]|nr:hypothetical protein [Armatimonadota bacterium]